MKQFDSSFNLVVGRLLLRSVREILESEKFLGREIEWREGSGWIEHLFTVRGVSSDVMATYERLTAFLDANCALREP